MGDGGEADAETAAAGSLGVLRGTVTTATGEPVADARVALAAGPGELPDVAALTGADGMFAFGALHPGQYRVVAFSDVTQAAAEVDVGAEAVARVVLVLE